MFYLNSKNIVIATGSRPRTLPGLEADGTYVMTSDEALTNDRTTKIDHYCWWWSYWDGMGIFTS